LGLRPTRPLRSRVRKLPKPRISTLSPDLSERTTLSKIVSTMISDSFRVNSTTRETSSIRSAFVIGRGRGRRVRDRPSRSNTTTYVRSYHDRTARRAGEFRRNSSGLRGFAFVGRGGCVHLVRRRLRRGL